MRHEVMLRPLQAVVLRYAVKKQAMLALQVVDDLYVIDVEGVLDHDHEELHELEPRKPRRVAPHCVSE
jgi:ureidoglycolate hydrolase